MKTQSAGLQNRISPRRGFTLVEMLLVLVILGILAGIAYPLLNGIPDKGRVAAAKTQLGSFELALDHFEMDMGRYPLTSEGLQALRERPEDSENWQGPYLKTVVPTDPWKRPYVYIAPGEYNPTTYDLSCVGKDGQEGTEDDITSWNLAAN